MRRINRLQFGQLLATAWGKAATVKNAVSSFKATGIVPFDPKAIPDYAYLTNIRDLPATPTPQLSEDIPPICSRDVTPNIPSCSGNSQSSQPSCSGKSQSSQPSCSGSIKRNQPSCSGKIELMMPSCSKNTTPQKVTPGKLLDKITPVPEVTAVNSVRKRGKQLASILTSDDYINEKKQKQDIKQKKTTNRKQKTEKLNKRRSSSSSEDDGQIIYDDSSDDNIEDESSICVGCEEDYSQTTKKEDWIKCINCFRWLHEGCSKYVNFCDLCGKNICKTKK